MIFIGDEMIRRSILFERLQNISFVKINVDEIHCILSKSDKVEVEDKFDHTFSAPQTIHIWNQFRTYPYIRLISSLSLSQFFWMGEILGQRVPTCKLIMPTSKFIKLIKYTRRNPIDEQCMLNSFVIPSSTSLL